jgi:hypothetical protein
MAPWVTFGALSLDRHTLLTIRNLTLCASRFIQGSAMSVITVKRRLGKKTPHTVVNVTASRRYRRSLVLRSFRQLSRTYFASEKSWEFAIEALLFVIIMAISAWPIVAAMDALNELLQRMPS